MRLLEVVAGPTTRPEALEAITRFADLRLGKGVVRAKDTPGLHRQPDRHLLAADGDRPGDRAGPDRRGGRRGHGQPGGHPQDRRVRAARSGRHRPDPESGRQHGPAAAGRRPAARQPPRAAPDRADDRGGLYRPEGQGRLLPPEPGERRAGQGGHRPPHRRLSHERQGPSRERRRRQGGRLARAGVPSRPDRPLRLGGAQRDLGLRRRAGAGDQRHRLGRR